MGKNIVCNKCEEYCILEIKNDDVFFEYFGNECKNNVDVKEIEIVSDKDILTSLVRIKGAEVKVVSVKSSKPIDKSLFMKCSRALSRINVGAPIRIGDIVCKNLLNLGVDIICTKNIDRVDN